jgi:hypothetical protein
MIHRVTIFTLQCVAEHGDSLDGYVAVEDDGNTYPLGSEQTFSYLVHRVGAVQLDSASILPYLEVALPLAGLVRSPFRIARRVADLPLGAQRVVTQTEVSPLLTRGSPGLWTASLTVVDRREVRRINVLVVVEGRGEISLLDSLVLWADASIH